MTPTPDAPVTVNDDDRRLYLSLSPLWLISERVGIMEGESDGQPYMQALARHRLAALASAPAGDGGGEDEDAALLADANSWYSRAQLEEIESADDDWLTAYQLLAKATGLNPDRHVTANDRLMDRDTVSTDHALEAVEAALARPRAAVAEQGKPQGLDVDGMCDDHGRFACKACVEAFDSPRAAVGEREAWELPDLRDLHMDIERMRDHDLGNDRMRDLLRGAMDMLKAADVEYAALQSPPAKVEPIREATSPKGYGLSVEGFGASYMRDLNAWVLYTMPSCDRIGQIDGYDRNRLDWIIDALRAQRRIDASGSIRDALLVFAACARDLEGNEFQERTPDDEYAKFRLLAADYRRAYAAYVALTGEYPPFPDEAHAALQSASNGGEG